MTTQNNPAPTPEPPTISASRLKTIGGEKGKKGCERKYAAQYLFGFKQESSAALEFGSALHALREIYHETGEIPDPESRVATVFRAGVHLIQQQFETPRLVEWEHWGLLPDGTPYVAFLDAHTERGGITNSVIVEDLKTTSNPQYALTEDDEDEMGLKQDIQVMMYCWLLLCSVHWFCPPLPRCDGDAPVYGPKHWRVWDPKERNTKSARARWLYFLTSGSPRAWEVTRWVEPAEAERFMQTRIMPLVEKIKALHQWRANNPNATIEDLKEFDRTLEACGGRGRWCGAGEKKVCDFSEVGTPIIDLIQLRKRPQMTPQERLAALRARAAGGTDPKAEQPAPVQTSPVPAVAQASAPADTASSTPATDTAATSPAVAAGEPSAPESADTASSSEPAAEAPAEPKKRGRPRKTAATPPAAPPGAGINPPEVVEALAKLTTPVITEAVPATPTTSELFELARGIQAQLPAGMSITIVGVVS